jgi:hypothetical protein
MGAICTRVSFTIRKIRGSNRWKNPAIKRPVTNVPGRGKAAQQSNPATHVIAGWCVIYVAKKAILPAIVRPSGKSLINKGNLTPRQNPRSQSSQVPKKLSRLPKRRRQVGHHAVKSPYSRPCSAHGATPRVPLQEQILNLYPTLKTPQRARRWR